MLMLLKFFSESFKVFDIFIFSRKVNLDAISTFSRPCECGIDFQTHPLIYRNNRRRYLPEPPQHQRFYLTSQGRPNLRKVNDFIWQLSITISVSCYNTDVRIFKISGINRLYTRLHPQCDPILPIFGNNICDFFPYYRLYWHKRFC